MKIKTKICAALLAMSASVATANTNPLSQYETTFYAKLSEAAYDSSQRTTLLGYRHIRYTDEYSIFKNNTRCILAFRGTYDGGDVARDVQTQLDTMKIPNTPYAQSYVKNSYNFNNFLNRKPRVVSGVYQRVQNLYASINYLLRTVHGCLVIDVTGHSLGAAVAQVFTFFHVLDERNKYQGGTGPQLRRLVHFNSPRVANFRFLEEYSKMLDRAIYLAKSQNVAFCRERDPVKMLPVAATTYLYRLNHVEHLNNDRGCTYVAPKVSNNFLPNHSLPPWWGDAPVDIRELDEL